MNFIFSFLTSFFIFTAPTAYAQTPSPIVFPIASLGNCADKEACKKFCNEPANQTACIAFAKEHGLTKQQPVVAQEKTILEKANALLGCTSVDACKALCALKENFQKCSEFAKSNNLPGGQKNLPNEQELLPQARALGLTATSAAGLKRACSESANRVVCTQLAQKMGLKGGLQQKPQMQQPQIGSSSGERKQGIPNGSFRPMQSPLPPIQQRMELQQRTLPLQSPLPSRLPLTNTGAYPSPYPNKDGTMYTPAPYAPKTGEQYLQTPRPYIATPVPQLNTGTVQGTTTELSPLERFMSAITSFFKR
jgi:hypothetical protein